MIIKTLTLGGALAASLALAAAPAQAENGRHAAFAAGAIGGAVAGAAIAGAAAAPARTYYSGPARFEVYDEAPVAAYGECYIERRQVYIDHARYVWKNVRVCE